MKAKTFYRPDEYIDLLDYCTTTTNLSEKAESIIHSIHQMYRNRQNISVRQYFALYNISINCIDALPSQKILKTIKFNLESENNEK